MPGTFEQAENHSLSERRVHSRLPSRSLAYVELDEGNGGIILNVSEGGLSVQAVMSLMDDVLPRVRFQLAQSKVWIETGARIAWKSESKKLAGLQFLDLPERAQNQIRGWLDRETLPAEFVDKSEVHASEPSEKVSAENRGEPLQKASQPVNTATARDASIPAADSTLSITSAGERTLPPEASAEDDMGIASAFRKKAKEDALLSSGRIFGRTFDRTDGDRADDDQIDGYLSGDADFGLAAQARQARATQESPGKAREFPTTLVLVFLFCVLAAISLGAGWIAGRRTYSLSSDDAASDIHAPGNPASDDNNPGDVASAQNGPNNEQGNKLDNGLGQGVTPSVASSGLSARVAEIEILDSNNQRWTIPFNAPGTSAIGSTGKAPFAGISAAGGEALRQQPPGKSLPSPLASANPQQSQAGIVQHGKIIHRVDPIYPADALKEQIEGIVRVHLTIGPDGNVRSAEAVSGPSELAEPSLTAVRQWRYSPAILDGKPVETQEDVTFTFRLP